MPSTTSRWARVLAVFTAFAGQIGVGAMQIPPARAASATAEVLASYPHGSYLENMLADADGAVFVTNYFARSLERWTPEGGAATFAAFDLYPVSLARLGDGYLLVAHAVTFDKIAANEDANRIVVLSRTGEVLQTFSALGAGFLNGIEPLGDGRFLIADSHNGTIWRCDPAKEEMTVWLQDAFLAKAEPGPGPGANGVHLSADGWVYISNSETKALGRVRMATDGTANGPLELIADGLPGIDDFALAPDGSVIIATHRHEIVRRSADGSVETLLDGEVVAGATSVVRGLGASQGYAFVTGTGGLFEGGKGDAHLLRFRFP